MSTPETRTVHIPYSRAPRTDCVQEGEEYTLELYVNSSTGASVYDLSKDAPAFGEWNADNNHYQAQGRWVASRVTRHMHKCRDGSRDGSMVYNGLNVTLDRIVITKGEETGK